MGYNQEINDLANEIIDLIEKYGSKMPSFGIGLQLISQATSMLLATATNELVGIKAVLSCVEFGIVSYEQTHS